MKLIAASVIALILTGCAVTHVDEHAAWTDATGKPIHWHQDTFHARCLIQEQWATMSIAGPMGPKTLNGFATKVDPQASAIISTATMTAIDGALMAAGLPPLPVAAKAAGAAAAQKAAATINVGGIGVTVTKPTTQAVTP